jgi:hypothetical protein
MKLKALNHFKAFDMLNEYEQWLSDTVNVTCDSDAQAALWVSLQTFKQYRKKHNV